MARYFFHATDGYAIAVDTSGRRLWSRDLEDVAADVATELRARLGVLADLSEWLVVVQDERGETVQLLDVAELEAGRGSLAAAA